MKRLIVACCTALGAAISFACGSSVNVDRIAPVSVAPAEAQYTTNAAASGQAGNSSVYQFDITTGSGRLTINLAEQRFVFSGKGYQPNRTYSLQYTVEGDAGVHVLASGVATPTGKLEIDGTWTGDSSILSAAAFAVSAPSAGGILTTVTVWGAGTDSCLGPYVYAGLFAITSPPGVPLGVGSVLGLSPSGTIAIVCDRYVQATSLIVNGTAYEAYMFPARSMCPISAPTCP